MMSEPKIAKIVESTEEHRRDNPLLPSREDHEAANILQPADHEITLSLIDETTDQRRNNAEG
ncbi:hypothetical protein SAMN05192583_3529 [Sphingomonas gellani]|uniref:Uncharacterized protein n=1 Tax=Sphingomonas gellani TaxID=1166340 RepID=A0A1H8J9U7_9SPHN|nr:hypothetical protein [Sphingomonas gellani]SEN77086.1 hypothetical protein SAMN05192583_3529 [Sphingomonas gellani]